MTINVAKLDKELKAAGLPIVGCASTGRIDWDGEPTEAQKARAQAILAAHDPAPEVKVTARQRLAAALSNLPAAALNPAVKAMLLEYANGTD